MKIELPKVTLPAALFHKTRATSALVIRAAHIEAVHVQGKKVAGTARVPIEGTGPEAMVQAIRQAVAAAGIKSKHIAVCVPSQDVIIRFFTIPSLPKAEWLSAVQFESRKYIPFKMDALVCSFHVAPAAVVASATAQQAEPALEVVFAGIAKESLRRFQEVLKAADLQPDVIEPDSVGLALLAAPHTREISREFVCAVDIGRSSAHVVIARQGVPYLSRDISLSEADPKQSIERLISELAVSIDFWKREYSGTVLKVALFGDEALAKACNSELASKLSYPVELGNQEAHHGFEGEVPLAFAAALGLLCSQPQGHGQQPTLDFIKASTQAQVEQQPSNGKQAVTPEGFKALIRAPETMVTAVLTAATLTAGLWFAGNMALSTEEKQLARLLRSQPPVMDELANLDQAKLKPVQEQIKEQLKFVKTIVEQKPKVAQKLDQLARALPEGIWFTGLSFEYKVSSTAKAPSARLVVSGACYLGGQGKELSAIQEFESRVKQNKVLLSGLGAARLGQVNAASAGQAQRDEYAYRTFQLNCEPSGRM